VLRNWRAALLGLGVTPIERPPWLVVGERLKEASGQLSGGDKAGRDDCRPEIGLVDPEPLARLLGAAEEAVATGGEAAAHPGDVTETGALAGPPVQPPPLRPASGSLRMKVNAALVIAPSKNRWPSSNKTIDSTYACSRWLIPRPRTPG